STRALGACATPAPPRAGTVLTAIRMGLVQDPDRGLFVAIPATGRLDRGPEFAAASVRKALACPGVDVHRRPAYTRQSQDVCSAGGATTTPVAVRCWTARRQAAVRSAVERAG